MDHGGIHVLIGKNKISRDFFLTEFQSNINYLNKKNEKLNKLEITNVANETLGNIANRYLILNAAKSSNIKISEKIEACKLPFWHSINIEPVCSTMP